MNDKTLAVMNNLLSARLREAAAALRVSRSIETLGGMIDALLADMEFSRAHETGDYRATDRQQAEIARECAQLGVTAEDVMQVCHACEDIDTYVDALYIRCVHDAWARGVRRPEDLHVHEAMALIKVCVDHAWTFECAPDQGQDRAAPAQSA